MTSKALAEEYMRPLNTELVMDALRYNGIEATSEDGQVFFDYCGEHHSIVTSRLPMIHLAKTYSVKGVDFEAMKITASQMADEVVMAKAIVDEEDSDITFYLVSVENNVGHFRSALPRYLEILNTAVSTHRDFYDKLVPDSGSDDAEDVSSKAVEPEIQSQDHKQLVS